MQNTLTKNLTRLCVILMDLLAGMEFDLFVPSFPALQNDFHLSPFWVEALLSANLVGYCISLFFVGWFSDHYGRKPIILIGLGTFILGSILCLSGAFYPLLLIGRFFQGVGIAAPAILSFLIIADAYPLKQQQYFMAILNGAMNIAVGIAPVLGSYITLYFHWQGNFVALLSLGVIVFIMTACFISSSHLVNQEDTPPIQGYLDLFKSKSLVLLITNLIFMIVPYWIFVGMSSLLYMKDFGVSLSHFGYYQGILALVFAFGSLFFGGIIHKYTQKNILFTSAIFYFIGLICIVIVTLENSRSPILITAAFLPFIISQIIPSVILYPLCLNLIPNAKARVSATLQGIKLIVTAVSLQIAGYFYTGSFQNIGIIISFFIIMTLLTHIMVMKNPHLAKDP